MRIVERWIKDACAAQPALMREVLTRPFSRLSEWIDWDGETPCGCLIGTTALVAGIAESEEPRDPPVFLAGIIGQNVEQNLAVGLALHTESVQIAHGVEADDAWLTGTHESDQQVIATVKGWIERELGVIQ
jgi:hypothetical protein